MKSNILHSHKLMLLFSFVIIFTIIKTTKVNYTTSDPHLALLTSQALIEKGTVNLNSYRTSVPKNQFCAGNWQYIVDENAHQTFYIFPLGTPLLSTPFVLAAKAFGMNMIVPENDSRLQRAIAAFLCLLIFYLLYTTGCSFLDKPISLLLSLSLFLGSSLISTMGTALWSFNYEIVFILLAIKEIINAEKGAKPKAFLIAVYLALAWVCRPTALSLIAVVSIWIFIKHRKYILHYLLGNAIVLIPFFIFTYCSFGKIIPNYYNPFYEKHLFLGTYYFTILKYVLFSPMRGLLVFTPILIIAFMGLFIKNVRTNALYFILFFHFIIHTLMLINHLDWFGAWCFGPRLYTDMVPSLSIMFFLVIKEWQPLSKIKMALVTLLIAASVFIHTVQGLYNMNVHSWNADPDLSEGLSFMSWNWQFPQFLATEKSNKLKKEMYNLEHEISFLVSKTPDYGTLLYGLPNENMEQYLTEWNTNNKGSSNEIYNSIKAIKLNYKKEFWFPSSLINEVKNDSTCIIVYPETEGASKPILLKAIINKQTDKETNE